MSPSACFMCEAKRAERVFARREKHSMAENVLLRMEGICKSFPGVKALDNAQLSVRAGTVHALMGENGAGKSTLMKCLFGIYSKDAGHIYLDGKEIDFKSSREALDNGVAMSSFAASVASTPNTGITVQPSPPGRL